MSLGTLDPIPYSDPPIEGDNRSLSKGWFRWLEDLTERLGLGPQLVKSVQETAQTAAISGTDLGVTQGGLYLVSWVFRVTTPATTNSSLTFSVSASDDGIAVIQTGAAETGNTITTVQSGAFLVQSDVSSPVTFSVAYSTSGATALVYKVSVVCIKVA